MKSGDSNLPPIHASTTSSRWMKKEDNPARISIDTNPYVPSPNPARFEQAGPLSNYSAKSPELDSVRRGSRKLPTETGNQNEASQVNHKSQGKNMKNMGNFGKRLSQDRKPKNPKSSKRRITELKSIKQSNFINKVFSISLILLV